MLRLEAVTKTFGSKTAVENVSLEIPPGQFVGVIGPSGAGKSTLLRMINRLTLPTVGRIYADGKDVTRLKGQALRDWRQSNAMIFQQFNLVGRLDVLPNVILGRLNPLKKRAGWHLPSVLPNKGPVAAPAVRAACSAHSVSPSTSRNSFSCFGLLEITDRIARNPP